MLIVRTDKPVYHRDEIVRIQLSWTNDSEVPQEVTFASAQRFDVAVERVGQVVWQWSAGKFFAQVLSTLVIQPGDSRVFKVEWDQRGFDHQLVPLGSYAIRAWIKGTSDRGGTKIELL
ncbi:BsuPI-related putative proteinase inhibitor [Tumebacillus flagellatus]|uniref:Intracellular proteinase inhibitor BsuPI domain-containing protein n=1 Tax=Tumebacillus flagellatus TaxID=1157490 RepID=A0A074LM58_9BACL|nr:BsuPI-related putative proteinase inhibitor [Tumebacillus flagellatus]KEO82189.1 hypothetical protein EL26_16770 [Tumebacillus flagellatus]